MLLKEKLIIHLTFQINSTCKTINIKTMKKLLFLFVLFTSVSFGQNVEFKAANFKDKKEEFKKAEEAISKGDEFFKVGMEAVFNVKDGWLKFQTSFKKL